MPRDQLERFLGAGYIAQPKQLLFHAACRECDQGDGPIEIGFGGARGPGKSHASFAQIALDDCQRVPNLKWLFLRKVAKAARESFEDLRVKVLRWQPHQYKRQAGVIEFPNGSRIHFGHFHAEKDIDNYLGIEYDGVVIEEATQLSSSKYQQIKTCVRTSKPNWRPRLYLTTNPGGVGHVWFKQRFIEPFRKAVQEATRFIPANFRDNCFLNKEYVHVLNSLVGWLRAAWKDGDWDIAAGQYFSNWRHDAIVTKPFDIPRHWPVWGGLDYGFTHPTAAYLMTENDGKKYVIGEHVAAKKLPPAHVEALSALTLRVAKRTLEELEVFVAGNDVFAKGKDSEGKTIAEQYEECGLVLSHVSNDRISGWGEILTLLGDPDGDPNSDPPSPPIPPKVQIFDTCPGLIECLPALQHDPNRPEDVLKVNIDDDGFGGDDPGDGFRYTCMAKPSPSISVVKL